MWLGTDFDRRTSNALSHPKRGYRPRSCIIMPCKGNEDGLEQNIEAVLNQDYTDYETVIVTDSPEDPAFTAAKEVLSAHPNSKAKLIISDSDIENRSGKVAALLTAIRQSSPDIEVYAFVDSDSLIPTTWLGEIVEPLWDASVGASTGFRWYIASRGIWSHVEAAWNAAGSNLMFSDRYNFPWGGAMAVRRDTLHRVDIDQVWAAAISDDMTLNLALRMEGWKIRFLPQCSAVTFANTTLTDLLSWAARQTTFTRFYNKRLWDYAAIAYGFFDLVFILAILSLGFSIVSSIIWLLPSALLFVPSVSGIFRSLQRASTFRRALPYVRDMIEKTTLADAMASFIVPLIMTYCIVKSVFINEFEWRGRHYQLK